jgi:hypothetical protein
VGGGCSSGENLGGRLFIKSRPVRSFEEQLYGWILSYHLYMLISTVSIIFMFNNTQKNRFSAEGA